MRLTNACPPPRDLSMRLGLILPRTVDRTLSQPSLLSR